MHKILMQGEIGVHVTAADVKAQLANIDPMDEIEVEIDSPGGSVYDGLSIHQAFARHKGPKTIRIESAAFSIASYITTPFDRVEIAPNGYLMIHNPSVETDGDDEQHAKDAELLNKLKTSMVQAYAKRTGKSDAEILSLMKAETFLNASEAMEQGFVTSIIGEPVASKVQAIRSRLPKRVVASLFGDASQKAPPPENKEPTMTKETPKAASVKEIRAAHPNLSDAFVLKCVEKELPLASVATAAAEELLAENEDLKAKIKAMEDAESEKAEAVEKEAKAKEQEAAEAKASQEDSAKAEATAKGNKPVSGVSSAGSSSGSARARWKAVVDRHAKSCSSRSKAVARAAKEDPELHQEMLAEANA